MTKIISYEAFVVVLVLSSSNVANYVKQRSGLKARKCNMVSKGLKTMIENSEMVKVRALGVIRVIGLIMSHKGATVALIIDS